MCASAMQAMGCKCLQREELCLEMGQVQVRCVYRSAKNCVGGSVECTAWRHLHRCMLECAE